MRWGGAATCSILLLAAGVRIWGVHFGLPAVYHQDEPILMNHALAAAADFGRPHFYILPALPMYVIDAGVGFFFLIGRMAGRFSGLEDLLTAYLTDPTPFYLIGRVLLGVLPGVLTVWVTMRIALRLVTGPFASRAAGVFVAVSPLAVQHSHYAYSDTLVTLALAVYLLLCLRWVAEGGTRSAWGIGIAMGLAAACKYNAVFYVPTAVMAAALVWNRMGGRWGDLIRMSVGCAAAFALGSPYTLLDGAQAAAQIFKQAGATDAPGAWHHVRHSLLNGLHEGVLLAALSGFVVLAREPIRRAGMFVMMAFTVCGLVSLALFSQHFARYALPLVPALAALAGVAVAAVWRRDRRLGAAVAVLLTLPLAATSADLLRLFAAEDTRTLCRAWFERNVPAGAVIARDHTFFAPPLRQDPELVRAAADPDGGVRGQKAEALARVNAGQVSYRIFTIRPTPDFSAPFQGQRPLVDATTEALADVGVEYVVFNGSDQTPDILRLRRTVACGPPVAVFDPFRGRRTASSDRIETTAAPLERKALRERDRLGPYLEVHQFKGSCRE